MTDDQPADAPSGADGPPGRDEPTAPDEATEVAGSTAPDETGRVGPTMPDEAPGRAGPTAPAGLSARDVAVLDFASRTWTGSGPRDRAVRERLGMSPTAYLQLLNALLDDPRALAYAPVTVNRLRARRDEAREAR